jgi:hypothetical protein
MILPLRCRIKEQGRAAKGGTAAIGNAEIPVAFDEKILAVWVIL